MDDAKRVVASVIASEASAGDRHASNTVLPKRHMFTASDPNDNTQNNLKWETMTIKLVKLCGNQSAE